MPRKKRRLDRLAVISHKDIVDPQEYQWEDEFMRLFELYMSGEIGDYHWLEVGKVLGLARAYAQAKKLLDRSKPLIGPFVQQTYQEAQPKG